MVVTGAQTARTNTSSILHHSVAVFGVCMYHLHSVWLFTLSHLKTIIGPCFIFGATNALAVEEYGLKSSDEGLDRAVLERLPLVLLYLWMNLLPFAVDNQKSPDAIEEDKINKPWRTLPSGRITLQQAERLMLITYLFALGSSSMTGGLKQSVVALVVLGTWYNNFAGADSSCLPRNLINALGYTCFISSGRHGSRPPGGPLPCPSTPRLIQRFGTIAAIISTTVQSPRHARPARRPHPRTQNRPSGHWRRTREADDGALTMIV